MSEAFNAAEYLLDRRLAAGDGDRLAVTGPAGDLTYAQLHDRVTRLAAALRRDVGLQPEQRLLMFMADSPDFLAVYLAAMRIGAVPVPVSTMLHVEGLLELLEDSRARVLATTPEFADVAVQAAARAPELGVTLLAGPGAGPAPDLDVAPDLDLHRTRRIDELVAGAEPDPSVYRTTEDSPAFWLYTSGTTGTPKGAMHRHGAVRVVCEAYGAQVLGIRPDDRCLSAAKAFFAYGLGNSVLFPLSAGAATVLEPAASKPEVIAADARRYGATLFFAGPTFFANMLRADLPADAIKSARLAASAGEPLPASLYQRWTSHFGVDILDGIGMTELLHIFLSNRAGDVHPGTTGLPVPGYDLKILDDDGEELGDNTPGTLYVRGDSTAVGYWSRYAASRDVFRGEWLRTGDTYVRDEQGYYACLGRTGDMIKASGIWVSPGEVEERLAAHAAVGQAVVVSAPDREGLEKPVAYVLLADAHVPSAGLEAELIEFCREGLPSIKRPRRIVFVDDYPTTATGKIRRVELRSMAAAVLLEPESDAVDHSARMD